MAHIMSVVVMFIGLLNEIRNQKSFKISNLAFLNELETNKLVKELIIQYNRDSNLVNTSQMLALSHTGVKSQR